MNSENKAKKHTPANHNGEQMLAVRKQYIKDLSFENPLGAAFLPANKQPEIQVNMEAEAEKLEGQEYEVILSINVEAKLEGKAIFILELVYAGLFVLENIPEDILKPVLFIECPRLLFPFARNVVADTVREAGFPPLLLNPVDFAALFESSQQEDSKQH